MLPNLRDSNMSSWQNLLKKYPNFEWEKLPGSWTLSDLLPTLGIVHSISSFCLDLCVSWEWKAFFPWGTHAYCVNPMEKYPSWQTTAQNIFIGENFVF